MKNESDVVSKQVAIHSRAMGRQLDPENISGIKRTADADAPRGALSGAGQSTESPLTFTPNHFGTELTPVPRVSSGVNTESIVNGTDGKK
jgi:hypothetical protein